jgi:hypothetical protein
MTPIILFITVGLVTWFCVDTLHTLEVTKALGKEICSQYQLQLLDDTVVLVRVRVKRDSRGRWGWQRTFLFEFSDSGNNRKQGMMLMRGVALEMLELPGYVARTISPV